MRTYQHLLAISPFTLKFEGLGVACYTENSLKAQFLPVFKDVVWQTNLSK